MNIFLNHAKNFLLAFKLKTNPDLNSKFFHLDEEKCLSRAYIFYFWVNIMNCKYIRGDMYISDADKTTEVSI